LKPDARYTDGDMLLDALEHLKLHDDAIERICSRNARELFKLD
jgi:predicted TIM-barrel fold metal-dependent hydrolase